MNFYDADCPWVPTLLDVERMKASEPDGSPIDWRRFGWSALDVPANCEHVVARFDTLGERFLERYAYRMLNAETMEKWQVRLQNRFDEVVDMYERAYQLYEDNKEAMMNDVLPGTKREFEVTDTNSGSDNETSSGKNTGKSKSKFSDTPDSLINDSDNYAGSLSKVDNDYTTSGTNKKDYGRVISRKGKDVTINTGGELVDAVNHSIEGWKDIDTAFIASFENIFMNIWWY